MNIETLDQWLAKQLVQKSGAPAKPKRKRASEKNCLLVDKALKRGLDSVATIAADLQMTHKQVSCSLGVLRKKNLAYISGFVTNSSSGGRIYLYRTGRAPANAPNRQPSSSTSWNFDMPHLDRFVRAMTADVHNWMYLCPKT